VLEIYLKKQENQRMVQLSLLMKLMQLENQEKVVE
jgi:hypothetical protein